MVAAGPVLRVDVSRRGARPSKPPSIVEVEVVVEDPLGERRPGGLVERQDPAVRLERGPDLGPERRVVVGAAADGEQR